MSNLTPDQIRAQKMERFKKMGIPVNFPAAVEPQTYHAPTVEEYSQTINESYIDMPQQEIATAAAITPEAISNEIYQAKSEMQSAYQNAPQNKRAALDAIKKGLKRQELTTIANGGSGGGGVAGYQLPVPKVGKKPSVNKGQQSNTGNYEAPQSFNAAPVAEAMSIENMFESGSGGGVKVSSAQPISGGDLIPVNDYADSAPSFDPVAHLRKKAQQNEGNAVIKEQTTESKQSVDVNQITKIIEQVAQKPNYDLDLLKEMMENVAKKVSEETMKKVLTEYANSQKNKNLYEVVNKEKNIIKIQDKYYKLTPVSIKTS